MTEVPIYVQEYTKISKKEDYRFRTLVDSLEFNNIRKDRLLLFEDILLGNETNLQYIFKPTRHDDVATIAFSELTDLPPQTIRDNTTIFEILFTRATSLFYSNSDNEEIISSILTIYMRKKTGLSFSYVQDKLGDDKLAIEVKVRLAQALSENEDDSSLFPWRKSNLKKDWHLVPAYMYYFYKSDPLISFNALADLSSDEFLQLKYFISFPSEKIVRRILMDDHLGPQFESLMRLVKSSEIIDMILNIIGTDEELALKFKDSIENIEIVGLTIVQTYLTATNYKTLVLDATEIKN